MENKKQTAVEWLVAELVKTIDYDNSENVEDLRIKLQSFIITSEKKAKEMEKQQIIETARFYFHERGKATPEKYYNQEYVS
jgi:hypothetical protein